MTQGVGLSVGATKFAAVIPGRAAATRQAVLTLYPHRPPEVGVPSENPRLDERALVVTGFVDRAADPVGIVAADGTFHRGETLIADALRALSYAVTGGRAPVTPPGVTFPAHWRPPPVEALRRELARLTEWQATPKRFSLVTDATAALTALQADPGLPTGKVIALCDFGGTGTSITLADAANGYRPIGATVRHADFSGEFIDRALLAHVIADLSISGTADVAGTAAIGSLHRLRAECRGAKERLSHGAATTLLADVPAYHGEVRLTRAELDAVIGRELSGVVELLREHLFRNSIHPADLSAIATVGGGANIPAVSTALSEQFRVPVITTAQPELTAARGAALLAVRRPEDESLTVVASPVQSASLNALAWSEVDDVPEIGLLAADSDAPAGLSAARPQLGFASKKGSDCRKPNADAWYRPLLVSAGVFAAMVLVGGGAVMAIRNDASAMTTTTTTTPVQPDPADPAAAPSSQRAGTPEQAPGTPSYIEAQPPATRIVVSTPPPVVMWAPAPAPVVASPPAENPPPASAPPTSSTPTTTPQPPTAPTTPPTPTTSPPPSNPPSSPSSEPKTPSPEPPSSEPSTPPSQPEPPSEQADQSE